jgi:geranylgeranyl transferase type-2 subunit beta
MSQYLLELTARLAAGLAEQPASRRELHRDFFLGRQRDDGGFAGREGDSDLYYTGFAVRGLALLDGLEGPTGERLASFLRSTADRPTGLIDLVSWIFSATTLALAGGPNLLEHVGDAWSEGLGNWVESFRTADGGYAKGPGGTVGSTYHTFLAVLLLQMLDRGIPAEARMLDFLRGRAREDGGFVEIDAMRRSGTNPTAAAATVLNMYGELSGELREGVGEFLASLKNEEGGLLANSRIPIADALSTFTGYLTVQDLGLAGVLSAKEVGSYAESLELPSGGFRGAAWDKVADVEYSFYGLGCLALAGSSSSPTA